MTGLLALFLGLLLGLMLTRRLRPLLLERLRALPILVLCLLASLLLPVFNRFWPALLWTDTRALLLTLQTLPVLFALLFIAINCLPGHWFTAVAKSVRWYHRFSLLIIAAGLIANSTVLLSNAGYWPIPGSYLSDISNPVTVEGIRNQALLLKRLIGPETVLPGWGQVWRSDLLTSLHLSPFPYISPGEVLVAAGLFLSGFTQFFTTKAKAAAKVCLHPKRVDSEPLSR
ncbi:MAG TPA: hypothetical protein DCM45_06745 [Clostridiales bacterium]|nr:hypothetical protein [Clostridiales bacterium]